MSLFRYNRNENYEDEFDRFVNTFFGAPLVRRTDRGDKRTWSPSIDMHDTGKEVVLHAELPGVKKENISLDIHGNSLVLSGETKINKEYEEGGSIYRERQFGNFSRTIPLPKDVDTEKVLANFSDGVLEVKIPKKEQAAPKKISIS
ncbi:HSP20-like chaperone [Basidiobolus meristosporus CBS 931.73]|uniref:HSP20-like chaperone n=1 Tax=Basidiobolus meristosporus CBS 931.73 TaxID=1314790 RepID=A0A1Y1XXF5_9FUNG|nr:HSP20-like chaperone [Basidiobolus meristosporus CBS 931.73]|eukprot:ORX90428.1 HSP20-like chaperone [Basidiobolus meristosporus CBS 931.73]